MRITQSAHVINRADHPALLAALAGDPVNTAWQVWMAEPLDTPHDYSAAGGAAVLPVAWRGDLNHWTAAIRAFAARPNTVCKLSGLVTEAAPGAPGTAFRPVADAILSAFGPDRVMFGSDWPVCLLASDYCGVLTLARSLVARLSEAEQTAIFASNAARVYGLGRRVPGP
jgi:predicted TIM-barrel fold metal-dependent hydrolase